MKIADSLNVVLDPQIEFEKKLINHLEKVQSESSTILSTRVKLNISREELDYIVYLLGQ